MLQRYPIFPKKFCLYKYVYVPWRQTEDVTQIGVGLIENVHGDPSSADARFDIGFCPPKGAKPQQRSKRPDTLYKNIAADMAFNKSYSSKKGKKNENEDTMLDRNVMLAFNLTLNKDGTFIQKKDGKYSLSSFEIASHVIELIYSEKTV